MDTDDIRHFARLFQIMKFYEGEFLAHRAIYEAVEHSGLFPDLAESLSKARIAVQPEMDQKYDRATETLLKLHDQRELAEVLRKLDPKAPIN
jgi:cystathionine beta-lyase family protein involved in aluminum resistance